VERLPAAGDVPAGLLAAPASMAGELRALVAA